MTAIAISEPRSAVRRPTFVWLLGATMLPFLVAVTAGASGVSAPVRLTTLLFGVAHVPTTFAMYADPALRPFLQAHPLRCVWVPLALVVGAGAVAALAPTTLLAYLIGGFACWQIHHFTKQNLGMVSFYCRATGLRGSDQNERRLVVTTGIAAMLGLAPFLPQYLDGRLPWADDLWLIGRGLLVVVGIALVVHAGPGRRLPLAVVAAFYSPLFLFYGNLDAAVLGIVAGHGAQYFLMVGHLTAGNRSLRWAIVWSAVIGYMLMSAPTAGVLFGAVLGVTMAHFVVDAGMWRMRDPERRAYIRERFSFL